MKKEWNKPLSETLNEKSLSHYIKVAARSWCDYGVLR